MASAALAKPYRFLLTKDSAAAADRQRRRARSRPAVRHVQEPVTSDRPLGLIADRQPVDDHPGGSCQSRLPRRAAASASRPFPVPLAARRCKGRSSPDARVSASAAALRQQGVVAVPPAPSGWTNPLASATAVRFQPAHYRRFWRLRR
jgi:hypothetical protein